LEVCPKDAVAQDRGPQPASAFQEIGCAGRKRLIHPIAGPAFFCPEEMHTLNPKLLADQLIQVHTGGNHVAPERGQWLISRSQFVASCFVGFPRKKGYLALVVFFKVKKTVTPQAASRNTVYFRHLYHPILAWWFPMVAKEIVARGNVEPANFHASSPGDPFERFHNIP